MLLQPESSCAHRQQQLDLVCSLPTLTRPFFFPFVNSQSTRAGYWKTLMAQAPQGVEITLSCAGSIQTGSLPVLLSGYLEGFLLPRLLTLSQHKGQESLDLPRMCFFLISVQDPSKVSLQGLNHP